MRKKSDVQARVGLVGLCASIVAVVAVSVTVLTDKHRAGFGRVIPREEQMELLLIAVLLFGVEVIAYLIYPTRASTRATARTSSAAPIAKNRS